MKKWVRNNRKGFAVFAAIVVVVGGILFVLLFSSPGNGGMPSQATIILNDLRNLKSAALLFYDDKLRWPAQDDIASLDKYADRPIVNANPKRYAAVMIGPEFLDSEGKKRVNIGVWLKAENGTEGIRKKLEAKVEDSGLLNGAETLEPYKMESMEVFMNMR